MRRTLPARQDTVIGVLPPGGRFQALGACVSVDLHTGTAGVMTGVSRVLPVGSVVLRRAAHGLWQPAGVVGDSPVRLQCAANVWLHPDGLLTHGSGRELDGPCTHDAWVRFVGTCVTTIVREMAMA